ncbi:MAG: hypothetical protein ACOZAI_10510, partial [Pseudomonadota bacterium]
MGKQRKALARVRKRTFEDASFKAGEINLQRLFKAASGQACGLFRPPQGHRFGPSRSRAGDPI